MLMKTRITSNLSGDVVLSDISCTRNHGFLIKQIVIMTHPHTNMYISDSQEQHTQTHIHTALNALRHSGLN